MSKDNFHASIMEQIVSWIDDILALVDDDYDQRNLQI